jgi:hypothetical protein
MLNIFCPNNCHHTTRDYFEAFFLGAMGSFANTFLNVSPIPFRLVLVLVFVLVAPLPDDSASNRPIEHSVDADVEMYFRSIDLIRWRGITLRLAVTKLWM